MRPLAEVRAFPEVGFYRQEAELSDSGSDEALLVIAVLLNLVELVLRKRRGIVEARSRRAPEAAAGR